MKLEHIIQLKIFNHVFILFMLEPFALAPHSHARVTHVIMSKVRVGC